MAQVTITQEGAFTRDIRTQINNNFTELYGDTLALTNTAITTVGAGTLTAASIFGALITRSGPTGAYTDTTDTAAAIIALLGGDAVGTDFVLTVRNTVAFPATIAAGTGVTLAGNIVIPPLTTAEFLVNLTTATTITITGMGQMPIVGTLFEASTALTTVGAGTILAAAFASLLCTRTGPTVAYTDTTDTAANIIAAIPNWQIGGSYEFLYLNQTNFKGTLAGGTGVTASGLLVCPPNGWLRALVTYSAAGAVTFNGLVSDVSVNSAGDMPSSMTEQFGASTATMLEEGNINRQISSAGINPGGTAADNVLAVYTLPANAFDLLGRGLSITAQGSFGATGNNKRIKIIWNPATAVVGSTVGGSGTTIADTAVVATSGGGWSVQGNVFKYGANGSNTQICLHQQAQIGSATAVLLAPSLATATESGTILVAVTGNATTATTDIIFNFLEINAMN